MRVVLGASVAIAMLTGCATGAGSGVSAEPPRATTRVLGTEATQPTTPTDTASPSGSPSASPTATAGPCGRGGSSADYTHVVWIWMENRSYTQVLGSSGKATRLRSSARRCGVATSYYAITHPSLPNYLAAVSGSTGGVRSDCSAVTCPQRRPTLFGQVKRHG